MPDPKHLNCDLVLATWNLAKTLLINWIPKHVNGHQDDKLLSRPHTRTELVNMEMDTTAKAHWLHIILASDSMPLPPQHAIMGEDWQSWIGTRKLNALNPQRHHGPDNKRLVETS